MPGVSRRSRLNLSATEKDVGRVVAEINKLPFAFVGFGATRSAMVSPLFPNTWEAVSFNRGIDYDSMLNGTSASSATVKDGADGVYLLSVRGSMASSTGSFRFTVNGTAVFTAIMSTTEASHQSPPIALRPGDVIRFEFQVANTSWLLNAGCAVSAVRVGLFP
jgi:hypothetical protein